jgi:hypothetical protein
LESPTNRLPATAMLLQSQMPNPNKTNTFPQIVPLIPLPQQFTNEQVHATCVSLLANEPIAREELFVSIAKRGSHVNHMGGAASATNSTAMRLTFCDK